MCGRILAASDLRAADREAAEADAFVADAAPPGASKISLSSTTNPVLFDRIAMRSLDWMRESRMVTFGRVTVNAPVMAPASMSAHGPGDRHATRR